MIYYFIGYLLKSRSNGFVLSFPYTLIFVLLSLVSWIFFSPLGVVDTNYQCFIINVLGSVGAIELIYILSKKIGLRSDCNILSYIGRISLLVLCVHLIELDFDPIPNKITTLFTKNSVLLFIVIYRIIITLILSAVLSKIKIVKQIFCIN